MRNRKFLIPMVLMAFLVVLLGCSSFFSLSWKTDKKVMKTPGTVKETLQGKKKIAPSGPTFESGRKVEKEKRSWPRELQITRLPQKSPGELRAFMERLKAHGIQVIYFRVFQNPGDAYFRVLPIQAKEGVYFRTSYAPLVSDLLPLVCHYAHENGIEVYAWMNTLKAAFLRCKARHVYRYDASAGRLEQTASWSPFDPRVQEALEGVFQDLARNPVDGILVQDDLILHYNEDLGVFARRLFAMEENEAAFQPGDLYELGTAGEGKTFVKAYTPHFWKWSRWKSRKLAGLAGRLRGAVKGVRSSTRFAVDVNYEALSEPKNALAWFSRSIRTMEEITYPDYYMVMSYQRQMQEELDKPGPVILEYLRNMVTVALGFIPDPERWIFKVQTIDWRTRKPIVPDQIRLFMETIESAAPVRTCMMPYVPSLFEGERLAARLAGVRETGKP